MIGWNFPPNNYGKEDGLNDAGIETFLNRPLVSLAREIVQNSRDARLEEDGRPVEVHFNVLWVAAAELPGLSNLREILQKCKDYWNSNAKARRFFENAIRVASHEQIAVLKISDYNTTGLRGAEAEHGTDWHNLVKSVGASDKSAGAGGSFGIGKHAPFACSDLRTVFYATKDDHGQNAFQGVAKLVTHDGGDAGPTQGTGYFGLPDRNRPVLVEQEIPPLFRRTETGTDVYVIGFHQHAGSWGEEIVKSVIDNFFYAIHNEELSVRVDETIINKNSLPDLVAKYYKDDVDSITPFYFDALTVPHAHHFPEENFKGMGPMELFVLPSRHAPKRVAMIRRTGMVVYDKGHFRTPMRFAGVFIAKGEKLNDFLRGLEPPSHDAWEIQRHEDPSRAKTLMSAINQWINDKVKSLTEVDDAEEVNVDVFSDYLPDDMDELTPPESDAKEGEKAGPKPVEVQIKQPTRSTRDTSESGDSTGDEGEEGSENKPEAPGKGTGGGRSEPGGPGGEGDEEGNKGGEGDATTVFPRRPLRLKSVRVYCSDPSRGKYNVAFEPEVSGAGYISLRIVGEVGEEPVKVSSVCLVGSSERVKLDQAGIIGPLKLEAGKRKSLQVELEKHQRYALEVAAHAD